MRRVSALNEIYDRQRATAGERASVTIRGRLVKACIFLPSGADAPPPNSANQSILSAHFPGFPLASSPQQPGLLIEAPAVSAL
jgi:hypothetical protein